MPRAVSSAFEVAAEHAIDAGLYKTYDRGHRPCEVNESIVVSMSTPT